MIQSWNVLSIILALMIIHGSGSLESKLTDFIVYSICLIISVFA